MFIRAKSRFISLALIGVMTLTGCATDEFGNRRPLTDSEKGAIIGAGLGVLAGLTTKDKKKKAVLYGLVGGIAGGAVGHYMDNQKKDFEKQLRSEIEQGNITVEKLPENNLMVTMTAHTAFNIDSTTLKEGFKPSMGKIAGVVNKYGKTHLNLVGHTDNTGSRSHNQALSERRAQSVQAFLGSQGVIPQRMSVYGMGEDKPRASNATEHGRTLNRRVEIIIEPIVEGG